MHIVTDTYIGILPNNLLQVSQIEKVVRTKDSFAFLMLLVESYEYFIWNHSLQPPHQGIFLFLLAGIFVISINGDSDSGMLPRTITG